MEEIGRKFAEATWLCEADQQEPIPSVFTLNDRRQKTKVLKFPFNRRWNCGRVVTISCPEMNFSFRDVPFCQLPERNYLTFAALATQNYVAKQSQVLDWIAWHLTQGFDHFTLYVKEPGGARKMRSLMSRAISNQTLSIVDWGWPPSHAFHDQVPQEMSAIYRSRGRVKWLGLNDLDEIFIAHEGRRTMRQFLEGYESVSDSIGSLAACSRLITGNSPGVRGLDRWRLDCSEGGRKPLLRPDNVDYCWVHWIVESPRTRKYVAAHGKLEMYVKQGTFVLGHYGPKWDLYLKGAKTVPWNGISYYMKEIEYWISCLSSKRSE
jgi:hypothetical protein